MVVESTEQGQVDLARLFERLEAEGLDSLLIEGGSGVITSVLRQRLAQRLVVCIAPCVIGSGTNAVGDLGVARLSEAITFAQARFTPLEDDMIFEARLGP